MASGGGGARGKRKDDEKYELLDSGEMDNYGSTDALLPADGDGGATANGRGGNGGGGVVSVSSTISHHEKAAHGRSIRTSREMQHTLPN